MTPIDTLIQIFSRLPGLGPRSARRLVLHLIRNREKFAFPLLSAITDVVEHIRACTICGNLDSADPCHICADARRDAHAICVVEDVADLWAIERSHTFRGRYHVLGGTLSALDGRGPDALHIDGLMRRLAEGTVTELILATNATVEGQTTAHYLTDLVADMPSVRVSRLAQGIPFGGELDYLDDGTLAAAFNARVAF
jgi:recombination protein RecR